MSQSKQLTATQLDRKVENPQSSPRRRRQIGDRQAAATRHLFNKVLGQLYCCLQHRQVFDENRAFNPVCEAA